MAMSIGEQIKKIREEKGWTQNDLAEKLGASLGSVNGWETGRTEPSRAKTRKAITKVLGIEFPDEGSEGEEEETETATEGEPEKSPKKKAFELARAVAAISSDQIRMKVVRLLTVAQEQGISLKSLTKLLSEEDEDSE